MQPKENFCRGDSICTQKLDVSVSEERGDVFQVLHRSRNGLGAPPAGHARHEPFRQGCLQRFLLRLGELGFIHMADNELAVFSVQVCVNTLWKFPARIASLLAALDIPWTMLEMVLIWSHRI